MMWIVKWTVITAGIVIAVVVVSLARISDHTLGELCALDQVFCMSLAEEAVR